MAKSPSHRYTAFVESCSPALPVLPAMHTCFGRQFLAIMDNRAINVGQHDDAIGKKASFFFYGKASYRPKGDGKFGSGLSSALFSFVLDYNKLACPDGMLPFDSGAYHKLYRDMCGGAALEEYYLPQEKDSPARVVNGFFGNNNNYYDMKVRDDLSNNISKLDFHSESLKLICNPDSRTEYDQRAASIEMHFVKEILLDRSNLLALVGPASALEDKEIIAFTDDFGADRVPYKLDRDNVEGRHRQVRDATRDWLEHNGFISA